MLIAYIRTNFQILNLDSRIGDHLCTVIILQEERFISYAQLQSDAPHSRIVEALVVTHCNAKRLDHAHAVLPQALCSFHLKLHPGYALFSLHGGVESDTIPLM